MTSVFVDFLFDMQISLILKIQSLYVWKLSCENFSLLAEAKCHTVWKMIVCIQYSSCGLVGFFWYYQADLFITIFEKNIFLGYSVLGTIHSRIVVSVL